MDSTANCRLTVELARRLRDSRNELTQRWLERIAARVAIEPNRIFPSDELLDHVPVLMEGIADYLEDPADEITADAPVVAKAIELGELRHAQGFGAHQILKEYEILGGVLFSFLMRTADRVEEPCTRGELLACAHRLFRAISVILQYTTTHYLALADERVREKEQRLRGFNRTVSHELKNRIGAVTGAAGLLREEWVRQDPAQVERFARIVGNNADAMEAVLQDLLSLSRTDADTRRERHVLLPSALAEVARQLREMAADRGVAVRILAPLPEVEVNAAAVELCLSNYISNAIKYSDPQAEERWVEVWATLARDPGGTGELTVGVRDNGLGVPEERREALFRRFFRAHEDARSEVGGTGLGLSIVRETVEALGGRAWAEFGAERGATFFIALPYRRASDRVALPAVDDTDPRGFA